MKVVNQTRDIVLADEVVIADTLSKRLKGLLGEKEFRKGAGLIIKPCNSIHTFFMRFSIDVLFVDKNNQIIKAISAIKPFRITWIYFKAVLTIELPAGTIQSTCTQEGDIIALLQ